jgi:glycosyltransferase involved in cell wall biosynthesis
MINSDPAKSVIRSSAVEARPGVLQLALALAPGGTERLILETVRRLRHAHRMTVCCLDRVGLWGEDLQREGVDVHTLSRQPGFQPALALAIAKLIDATHARVLHCHHYTPFVYGCLARLLRPHVRIIFTEHGRLSDGPPSRKRWLANHVFSAFPDRVCAVSSDLRAHMIAEGFGPQQVQVVPNGIDPGLPAGAQARQRARSALNLADDAFVAGTVGRLDQVKDIPTLIRGFAEFLASRPSARLVIVGEGPLRPDLESCAAAAGVAAAVRFAGHRQDVRELFPAFDVYVSSSTFEGVSLTILEGMAAGRPVIATRVGGTPEVVDDGVTGWLIPSQDVNALAERLRFVAAHPDAAAAAGLAGRARVLEHFNLERMIEFYSDLYGQLAA